jgi:ribonuclease BN (tRNA processing enzyme)
MKVKILGTGTAVPSLKRASSAYLVLTTWGNILVDIGPSVVRRLLEFGFTVNDVDMIVLTHFHPDHTVDLPTFLFACNYGEQERSKPLVVVGGKGLRVFYANMAGVYPWIKPVTYKLTTKVLSRSRWRLGPLSIASDRMRHRDESIGVRIEEAGKSAVFSGDTDYTPALGALASRTDLLVVECSFPVRKLEGHLNLDDVRRVIQPARPRKVLLSHLYPAWEESDTPLPAPLLLAEDGLEIDV